MNIVKIFIVKNSDILTPHLLEDTQEGQLKMSEMWVSFYSQLRIEPKKNNKLGAEILENPT